MMILLAALMLVIGFACGTALSAENDKLIETARKEGKMVFYTSVETEFARSLTPAFEA